MDENGGEEITLRWDAHACLPLHPNASLEPLLRYREAGVSYVSINVGMDLNPLSQVMQSLAHFRYELQKMPTITLAGNLADIRQAACQGLLSVGFDLEGSLPLLDNPEMVYLYRDLGVRQMHLAYNRNNSVAGGCHDTAQGLSELGREMIMAMNHAGMIVDCSHMSKQSSLDVIGYSQTPVVFSHANPSALVTHQRNIDDEQLKTIGEQGGVVCLNGVNLFLGEETPSLACFLDHICYVADLIGVSHVGIGLDQSFPQVGINDDPPDGFDPRYWWPVEAGYTSGISTVQYLPVDTWLQLPDALSQRGFVTEEINLILGENMARVLEAVEVWNK
jgi:membrane dipeptidase